MDQEILAQKINSLEGPLREFYFSEEGLNKVLVLVEKYHLSEEKIRILVELTGQVILGVINPDILSREIVDKAHVDQRVANDLASDIKIGVFSPIAHELNKKYGFHLAMPDPVQAAEVQKQVQHPPSREEEAPPPKGGGVSKKPAPQPQPAPKPAPQQPKAPPTPQGPAVIHQHEETQTEGESGYPGGLVRPSFYEAPGSTSPADDSGATPAARLEIGSAPNAPQPTTKIGKEDARVVHYDTPDAPENPFSGSQPPPQPKPKKEVPNSNVVNLKDLPQ